MPLRTHVRSLCLSLLATVTFSPISATHAAPELAHRLQVEAVVQQRVNVRSLSTDRLAALQAAVAAEPRRRKARLELVRSLVDVEKLDEARREALAWREHDAYNLVAVRLLGDIESARGDKLAARRIYSSIVELLPRDVEARRALATVLKQAGDLKGAAEQLSQALALREEDSRIRFELGDVEQRLGKLVEARARFRSTAQAADADESLRYPARQRLARLIMRERRAAWQANDASAVAACESELRGLGLQEDSEHDLTVFLSWDTDRTDVDLWVVTPSGEKVFYAHARGRGGETLYHDVTTGYGPESFTVRHATRGEYRIFVNYYGARPGDFKEARGEVLVVTHEGRPEEREWSFPYRLFEHGETVEVARVRVEGGAS